MPYDIDAFYKKYGGDPTASGAKPVPLTPPAAPGAQAAPATKEPAKKTGAPAPPKEEEFSYTGAAARGLGRGLTELATNLGELTFAGTLAKQIPGVEDKLEDVKEFTEGTGKESKTEWAAKQVGALGPLALTPSGLAQRGIQSGLTRLLTRTVQQAVPSFAGKGMGFAMTSAPASVVSPLGAATIRAGTGLGKYAIDPAVTGAAGGVMSNPNNPLEGAQEGALGALAAKGLGGALGSTAGKALGRFTLPQLAFIAAHTMTGMHYHPWLGPFMTWHSNPIGRSLRWAGGALVDGTGKVVGTLSHPAVVGGATTRTIQGMDEGMGGEVRHKLGGRKTDFDLEKERQAEEAVGYPMLRQEQRQ